MDVFDKAAVRLAAWLRHLDTMGGLDAPIDAGARGEYALLSPAASQAAVVTIDDLKLPMQAALLWPRELHWLSAQPFDMVAWVQEGLFVLASGGESLFGFGVSFQGDAADVWSAAGDSMAFGTYTKGDHTQGRFAWRRTSQASLISRPDMPLIAVLENIQEAKAVMLKESRNATTVGA